MYNHLFYADIQHVPVNVYQTVMEMIIADIITTDRISVIGVLTDLKDTWDIFWLNEKKVMGIEFTHQKSVMQFIHSMVLENEWAIGKRSLPFLEHVTVKRMKFNSMSEIEGEAIPDDIAHMEDFYEEMTEEDIHKYKIGKAVNICKHSPLFASFFQT